MQPDGKIVAVGYAPGTTGGGTVGAPAVIVRLNTDGTKDTSFGDGGVTSVTNNNLGAPCNSLALQPDGKIVIAGFLPNQATGFDQLLLLRFTSAGALDATFATGGIGLYNLPPGPTYQIFNSVRIQPDGKIVAAGYYSGSCLIARFLSDGTPDPTFGNGGYATIPVGSYASAYDVQILPSGKIIAAGVLGNNFGAVQVNADGSFDSTFGTGGVQIFNVSLSYPQASSIAIQTDGKSVICGQGQG